MQNNILFNFFTDKFQNEYDGNEEILNFNDIKNIYSYLEVPNHLIFDSP